MNTKKPKRWESSYPYNRKVQYPVCVSFDRDVEYTWGQENIHTDFYDRRDWLTKEGISFKSSMQELNDAGEVVPRLSTGKNTSWSRNAPKMLSWQINSMRIVFNTQTGMWSTTPPPPVFHTKKMRYNFYFRDEASALHFKLVWM